MPEIPSEWIERGSTVFVEHVIEEYRTAGPSRWWVCRCGQTGAAVGLDRAEKAVVAGRAHVAKALLTAVVLDGCEVREEWGQICPGVSVDHVEWLRSHSHHEPGWPLIRRYQITTKPEAVPVEETQG